MKNLKRCLSLVLVLAMLFTVVGCADNSSKVSSDDPPGPDRNPAWVPFNDDGSVKRDNRDGEGRNGVVTSANYEASKVGVDIIKAGGNAVDAAVGVAFALSAVESYYSGIGGGGFMTVRFAETGETVFIDFREKAPAAATPDTWPKDKDGKYVGYYQMIGGPSIGVPGEVKGLLYALETYGTMDRATVMAPAIDLAKNGFVVGPAFSEIIKDGPVYTYQPETTKIYHKEGLPYEVGDLHKNEDLATSLQKISDEGESAFYSGPIAEAIVKSANADGCQMTLEDLANYEVAVRQPVTGTYRGYDIISSPPPSSGGITIVEILNILENYDVSALEVNSPEYIHLFSEAFKVAYADRGKYMADTDFIEVPIEGLTNKHYAKKLSQQIDLTAAKTYTAGDPYIFHSGNTTHFSIMDKEGNMVSVTKTNNGGSGVTAEGTGILLNNEMADFDTGEGKANSIEGNKRPLSSMSPTLILKDGKPFMAVGSPGGTRIITTVAQVISHVIDHGMDIQDAIDTPRFFDGFGELKMETRIPETVSNTLVELGHKVTRTKDWDIYYGGVHATIRLEDGTLRGGADPRRDGKALGY